MGATLAGNDESRCPQEASAPWPEGHKVGIVRSDPFLHDALFPGEGRSGISLDKLDSDLVAMWTSMVSSPQDPHFISDGRRNGNDQAVARGMIASWTERLATPSTARYARYRRRSCPTVRVARALMSLS